MVCKASRSAGQKPSSRAHLHPYCRLAATAAGTATAAANAAQEAASNAGIHGLHRAQVVNTRQAEAGQQASHHGGRLLTTREAAMVLCTENMRKGRGS